MNYYTKTEYGIKKFTSELPRTYQSELEQVNWYIVIPLLVLGIIFPKPILALLFFVLIITL